MEQCGGGRANCPPLRLPARDGSPPGLTVNPRRRKLGPYLISSGSVGPGVGPQRREFLPQAVVGAVAEAVDDPRCRQDSSDAGEGEEGEEEKFGGLCLFRALRERRDVAFLQGRRERQRLSCAVAEQRGGRGPRRELNTRQRELSDKDGGKRAGRDITADMPPTSIPSLPGGLHLTTVRQRRARRLRITPRRGAPRIQGQRLRGQQQGKIRLCFFFLGVKNKAPHNRGKEN